MDNKDFHPVNYLKITIFGFAIAALWSSLHSIIIQLRLLDFVAESQKNSYLGILTGTGLILAIAVQPIAGAISDRSGLHWGRRRPYILLGTIFTILFLPGIGLCNSYLTFFIAYCLLQIGSNIAQGSYQAFIPDLVPKEKRGRASGVKTLLELAGGVALLRLVGPFMGNYTADKEAFWLWFSLGILALLLVGTMVATILTVKEKPGVGGYQLPILSAIYRSFKANIKRTHTFIWFLTSRLFIMMAFHALQKFALYFFMDVIGIANPAAVTADLLIIIGVGMLFAVYPAGRLSDKLGRKPIVFSSALLSALGIMLLFFSNSYMQIMLCSTLLGLSFGTFISTNWALATDLLPKGEEALYLGLTNLATAGGSALVLFFIGPTIDYFNTISFGLGYKVMFIICFVFFIAGALAVLKIKGPNQSG
ncbi:MAG: MFS transporter [Dehalococcoidales bacterium]|nr:MFS transporter [Dehalococcoidales bacterium]